MTTEAIAEARARVCELARAVLEKDPDRPAAVTRAQADALVHQLCELDVLEGRALEGQAERAYLTDPGMNAIKALRFYAEPENYVQIGLPGGASVSRVEDDGGKLARKALGEEP